MNNWIIHYKKTVRNFHDIGWKNSYHTSADVSMLGYGCGVSQYPQFFVEDLDIYQILPRPYLIFLMVVLETNFKKLGDKLGKSSRNIFLGMYLIQDNE